MTGWPIDKSALAKLGSSADAPEWTNRIERGLVRIAVVTRLEVAFSARNAENLRSSLKRPPLASIPVEYQTPAIGDRSLTVQLHREARRRVTATC